MLAPLLEDLRRADSGRAHGIGAGRGSADRRPTRGGPGPYGQAFSSARAEAALHLANLLEAQSGHRRGRETRDRGRAATPRRWPPGYGLATGAAASLLLWSGLIALIRSAAG